LKPLIDPSTLLRLNKRLNTTERTRLEKLEGYNRNRSLGISRAPLKSQEHQGTTCSLALRRIKEVVHGIGPGPISKGSEGAE